MIDQFVDIRKSIETSIPEPKLNNVSQLFSLSNVFSDKVYKKMSSDVLRYVKYIPEDQQKGRVPTTINIYSEKDNFYKDLWYYFSSDEMKKVILRKFNFKNIDNIIDKVEVISNFHYDFPHQWDERHTDQKNNLITITLQVYLPLDNKIQNYGTVFTDSSNKFLYETKFLPNCGYLLMSNNNSYHEPKVGVTRTSITARYTIPLEYTKIQKILNYDKDLKTCYIIWNKSLSPQDVLEQSKSTTFSGVDTVDIPADYFTCMTLQNMIEHNFKNIVVMKDLFADKLSLLKKVKDKGFEKAVIFLGGVIWKTDEIIKYVNAYNIGEAIVGTKECFIIDLNSLDNIDLATMHNNIELSKLVNDNVSYHNLDKLTSEQVDYFMDFVRSENDDSEQNLKNKIKYVDQYKTNYSSIHSLLYNIL